jgi:excinuclease UvrABC nuclease subunit
MRNEKRTQKANQVTIAVTRNGESVIGAKLQSDMRAMEFATKNANQIAQERFTKAGAQADNLPLIFSDEAAASDLAKLLSLPHIPSRIECFVSSFFFSCGYRMNYLFCSHLTS